MKNLIIVIVFSLSTIFSFSQDTDWFRVNFPSEVSLQAVEIDQNGDIYVFANNDFGAVSYDNGRSWQIMNMPKKQFHSEIVSAMIFDDYILLLCKYSDNGNFIQYFNKEEFKRTNLVGLRYLHNIVGNVHSLNKGRIFIQDIGSSYKLKYFGESILPYNFYLPFFEYSQSSFSRGDFNWHNVIGNKDRILSVLNRNGIIASIMFSDDGGFNWNNSDFSQISDNSILYLKDISFYKNYGLMLGAHYGGYDFSLFESLDNGESWSLLGRNLYAGEDEIPFASFVINYKKEYVVVGDIKTMDGQFLSSFIQKGDELSYFPEKINSGTYKNGTLILVGDNGTILIK